MITKNINGNDISQAFIDQIRSDSPNVIARLMLNGSQIDCDIVGISVEKGSCGDDTFSLGNVFATKLTATLKNLTVSLKGQEIDYQVGAWTGSDYEYINVCTVKVTDAKSTRYQTEITAYSSVVADTAGAFDASELSTIADVAEAIETQINRDISFFEGIDTTQEITASVGGLTVYQALQVLAICCGGYVINTNDNNIKVMQYDATPTLSVDTGMMIDLPVIEEVPYIVTGVYCLVQEESEDTDGNIIPAIAYSDTVVDIVTDDDGTYTLVFSDGSTFSAVSPDDTMVNLAFSSVYVTQGIYTSNIVKILTYEYYPADVDLTLGDPRLEGDDVLSLTDVDGQIYTVPCHKITHSYDGGFSSAITAVRATDVENSIGTVPPITAQLQQVGKDIVKAQNTASDAQRIARNNAQYFWFLETGSADIGTGAHITEIPKEQFMANPSGGNLLARSNGIAVRDGLTELATFGADGARVGASDYIEISEDGLIIGTDGYAKVQIAHINGETVIVDTTVAKSIKISNNGIELTDAQGRGLLVSGGNLYVSNDDYANKEIVDFVYEKGASGAWKYEKWVSGKVEAWGTILFSTLTFSAGGALYKSVNNAFSIPSGIFSATPTHGDAFIMGANMDYIGATVGGLSATGGNCEVWKAVSGNGTNVYVHIHLVYVP